MRTVIFGPAGPEQSRLIEALRFRGHDAECRSGLPQPGQRDAALSANLWVVDFPPISIEEFRAFREASPFHPPEPVVVARLGQLDDQSADILLRAGVDDVLARETPSRELAARLAVWECRVNRRGNRGHSFPALEQPPHTFDELRAIFEGAMMGIVIAELDGRRILRVNPAARAMFGYTAEEFRRLRVDSLHPPEIVPSALEHFQNMAAANRGRAWASELACRRKDGSVFHADIASHEVSFEGKPSLVGFFHDVSQRRAATQALAENEARFRAIFENAALGIAISGMDGVIVECNGAFAEMLGYTADELTGREIAELTHPDDWHEECKSVKVFKDGTFSATQIEKRYLHKDGHVVWGRLSLSFLPARKRPELAMGMVENITSRKLAEAALHESQEKFRNFIEASAYGYAELDLEGRIQFVSDRVLDMYGYPRQQFLGKHFTEFVDERDRPRAVESLETALREHVETPGEYLTFAADGHPVHVEVHGVPLTHDGQAVGFQCTLLDVTERTLARKRLAESEERYRLIADNVTDVIYTGYTERGPKNMGSFGPEDALLRWRFTYFSPSVERLLGYTVEEALRLRANEFLTPASYQLVAEQLGRRIEEFQNSDSEQGPLISMELELVRADGRTRWCEVTASMLLGNDGNIEGAVAVARDISVRREAERALRESEATLRNLIENMPGQVILVDREGRIEYTNRPTMGLSVKAIVGRSSFDFAAPGFREECQQTLSAARDQRCTQHCEGPDIYGRWWDCRVAPIVEDDGVDKLLIIANDVTQRKKTEAEVQQKQQLLRELLDLFERDREVLAFELHDGFAQQLTGAMLNLEAYEALHKQDPEKASQSYRRGIKLLGDSIAESRRLVGGLRPPVLDEFGIVPALHHLIEENQQVGGPQVELKATLRIRRLAQPLETAVFRILQETLTNARRHSASERVLVELHEADNRLLVVVQDWGVGFDSQHVPEGHFGLKGVQERARLLGGMARIESTPGQGTRIEVELPLLAREGETDLADRDSSEGQPRE
jgi:PAS domain S-box-containing protein